MISASAVCLATFVLFLGVIKQVWCTVDCLDAYSCVGVRATTTSDVKCYGSFSCAFNSSIEESSSGSSGIDIRCEGSFSCYNASYLAVDGTSGKSFVNCYGLYSCANILYNGIWNFGDNIRCYGELSCYNSWIVGILDIIQCFGRKSCFNSIIEGVSLSIQGLLAGANTIYKSNDSIIEYSIINDIYYYFSGYMSGYNSTIICDNTQTCNIECLDNACINLNLICDYNGNNSSNNECTWVINCDKAEKGGICNDGYDYVLNDSIFESITIIDLTEYYNDDNSLTDIISPNIDIINNEINNVYNITWTSYDNSGSLCNNNNESYNCDGYSQCQNQGSLLSTMEDKAICCSAREACINNNNITALSLRCDGYRSCSSFYDENGINTYNDNIYFTGSQAGYDGTSGINTFSVNMNNNNMYDIHCSAWQSCEYMKIENGNNLLCSGDDVCNQMIANNLNNIWVFSSTGATNSYFTNIENDVRCLSYQACKSVTIKNVSNDLFIVGQESFLKGNAFNVSRNMIIVGTYAASQANATLVKNILCMSDYSCQSTIITDFENLYATGYNSLKNSKIITSESYLTTNKMVKIEIDSETNTAAFDVYCQNTDLCYIKCDIYDACLQMQLYCYGTCYLDCGNNNNDNNCVSLQYGSYSNWPTYYGNETVMPTDYPTNDPTSDPSNSPTNNPTKDPTDNPTNNPTNNPTDNPTDNPTNDPTNDPTNEPANESTNNATNNVTDTLADKPTDDATKNASNNAYATTDATTDETSNNSNNNDESLFLNFQVSKDTFYVAIIIIINIIFLCLISCICIYFVRAKKRGASNNNNNNNNNNDNHNNIKDKINRSESNFNMELEGIPVSKLGEPGATQASSASNVAKYESEGKLVNQLEMAEVFKNKSKSMTESESDDDESNSSEYFWRGAENTPADNTPHKVVVANVTAHKFGLLTSASPTSSPRPSFKPSSKNTKYTTTTATTNGGKIMIKHTKHATPKNNPE